MLKYLVFVKSNDKSSLQNDCPEWIVKTSHLNATYKHKTIKYHSCIQFAIFQYNVALKVTLFVNLVEHMFMLQIMSWVICVLKFRQFLVLLC